MDYRELDPDDYEVAIGKKSPNGIQQITITVRRDAPFCEECLSVDAVKKCVATRKVLDVVDKQPVQYTINRYRYRCLECGRTFVNETLYEPKVRVAPEFSKFLAQKVLQDNLSEEQAANKYGVSTTLCFRSNSRLRTGIRGRDLVHNAVSHPSVLSLRIFLAHKMLCDWNDPIWSKCSRRYSSGLFKQYDCSLYSKESKKRRRFEDCILRFKTGCVP